MFHFEEQEQEGIAPLVSSNRSCVLFSGGLDGFLASRLFYPASDLLFVDTGSVYTQKEFLAAKDLAAAIGRPLRSIEIFPISRRISGSFEGSVVLHRNMHLILTAASLGYTEIILGSVLEDNVSDGTPRFFSAMERALNISHDAQAWNHWQGEKYTVYSPTKRYTKAQLIRMYLSQISTSDELLRRTVSCYSGDDGRCGQCLACFKRWTAFSSCGIHEEYNSDPLLWALRWMGHAIKENKPSATLHFIASSLVSLRSIRAFVLKRGSLRQSMEVLQASIKWKYR